jgi:hypothetical protein
MSVKVFQLLEDVFIDGVNHVNDLVVFLSQSFDEWGSGAGSSGFTSDNVDVFLSLLHSSNVVLERNHIFTALGGVVSQEFGQLLSVVGVLVDTQLKVLAELLVEFLVILSVLADFLEQFEAFLDDVLSDNL